MALRVLRRATILVFLASNLVVLAIPTRSLSATLFPPGGTASRKQTLHDAAGGRQATPLGMTTALLVRKESRDMGSIRCGEGCKRCFSEAKCDICFNGFFLGHSSEEGICKPCAAGCKRCSSSSTCKACETGKYLSGGMCSPCAVGCRECRRADQCSECDKSKRMYKYEDRCVAQCPHGTFAWQKRKEGSVGELVCKPKSSSGCTPSECFQCTTCAKEVFRSKHSAGSLHSNGKCVDLVALKATHPKCNRKLKKCHSSDRNESKCFKHLQCNDPCVCDEWKGTNCKITTSGSVPYNKKACKKTMRGIMGAQKGGRNKALIDTDKGAIVRRSNHNLSTTAGNDLDGALSGKCSQ